MPKTVAADVTAIACGLIAWGAHALVPWRLQSGGGAARRRWALVALPLSVLGAITTALRLSAQPDVAVAGGWTGGGPGALWRTTLVLFIALAAADGVLLWSRGRLERFGWLILSALSAPALIAWAVGTELFRTSDTLFLSARPLAAVLCVVVLALASAEAIAPGRPLWAIAGGGALTAYTVLLEPHVVRGVIASLDILTAAAALLLFCAARWLPTRLRRAGLFAATLLCALFLARVAWLSTLLAIN